jgi:hypothetical protein
MLFKGKERMMKLKVNGIDRSFDGNPEMPPLCSLFE